MSTYDDEIFDYLAKEENFRSAFEIYQVFPVVRDRLVDEFWQLVKRELEKLTEGSDWQVLTDDRDRKYSKLGVHLKTDTDQCFRVIYEQLEEQPYYGVWMDNHKEYLDKDRIYKQINDSSVIQNMKSPNNDFWIARKYKEDDFNTLSTLQKLLPDRRDDVVNDYAHNLFDFARDVKQYIRKMIQLNTS